ncbi:hypothetical protein MBLNU13_g01293t2 [Cladosporium sp. NU13]
MNLQSPLTQQQRPDYFEPKIVTLYRDSFRDVEGQEHTEGFWRELFLLKPDLARLKQILEDIDAEYLLHAPHQPRQLLLQALSAIKARTAPLDDNALDTLTVFFSVVLTKRFTSPSSDIIEVTSGLDNVDAVYSDLTATLENTIKTGRDASTRQKAIRVAIAVVAGGYQTAPVSYFVHRDLFPALMKHIQEMDHPLQASEPFLLVGLLANYDKFETQNQYKVRLAEYLDGAGMEKVIESIGWTCKLLQDLYVGIMDDSPAVWSIGGTLSYVGLGALARTKAPAPVLSEDEQRTLFAEQPGTQASSLLAIYDFALSNKLFCAMLVKQQASAKELPTPFSNFLSCTSYLLHHAYRTTRSSLYAQLSIIILWIFFEDPATAKELCSHTAHVRLCRQRPPYLPPATKGERPYVVAIIDILIDGINHNLRKRLDTVFYKQSIIVLSRILSHLSKTRTKLPYHWSELWRSLLSFVRFLTTYAEDLNTLYGTSEVVQTLVDLLTLALNTGESFLPDPASYDDLFYKLVESSVALTDLRTAYNLAKPDERTSINTLIGVSTHYRNLIDEHHKGKSANLSPAEVAKIIKTGYETLSIETREGLEIGKPFREADSKSVVKKVTRVAVADAARLVSS